MVTLGTEWISACQCVAMQRKKASRPSASTSSPTATPRHRHRPPNSMVDPVPRPMLKNARTQGVPGAPSRPRISGASSTPSRWPTDAAHAENEIHPGYATVSVRSTHDGVNKRSRSMPEYAENSRRGVPNAAAVRSVPRPDGTFALPRTYPFVRTAITRPRTT